MIDYDQIHHCLMHIISDCENGEEPEDTIESIHHTASHMLVLLRKPPAFEVNQKVWTYLHGQAKECQVQTIYWDDDLNDYRVNLICKNKGKISCSQDVVFPSMEALIEAQIKYWETMKVEAISASKTCPRCGMQRYKDGVCWSHQCSHKKIVPFEGEIRGFDAEYALSEEGQARIREAMKQMIEGCEHEYDGKFYDLLGNECNPAKTMHCTPKCKKCGEFYR